MDNLNIEPEKDSLKVDCNVDTGVIELVGTSYPEDAVVFFELIFQWLENFIKEVKKPVIVNLKIDYINSSSTKCMFDLMEIVEDYFKNGGDATINWYHKNNDFDMEEAGKEFKEDFDFPFAIIPYK